MESYPGQPTVHDLNETYHFPTINKSTRFVGVTGFEEADRATVAALNAAFASQQLPARCLPLGVGSMKLFGKVIDAVKLPAVVIDEHHRSAIVGVAAELDSSATASRSADVMLHKGDKWVAFDTCTNSVLRALEAAVRSRHPEDDPFKGRFTLLVGANDTALAMGQQLKARGAALIIASHDRAAAQRVAHALEARVIQFEALYSTMHDILIVCDNEEAQGGKLALRANYLKPAMTVLDLTSRARPGPFLRDAMTRGCAVVAPFPLWLDQVTNQAKLLTGKDVPRKLLEDAVPWLAEDESAAAE
jgi:shikimate 5-dehydrogenase